MNMIRRVLGGVVMLVALCFIGAAVWDGIVAFSLDDTFRALDVRQQNVLTVLASGCVIYAFGKVVKGRTYAGLSTTPSLESGQVVASAALAPTQIGFSEDRAAMYRKDTAEPAPGVSLDRVRVHEAGHAAVALHLGFSLAQVSTVAIGKSGGRVQIAGHPAGNQANEAYWYKAIMASAGGASELAVLGNANAGGVSQDVEEVQLLCATLAASDYEVNGRKMTADALAEEARRQAKVCVAEVAPHIEAIAKQLEDTPHITGKQAADLFDQVGKAA